MYLLAEILPIKQIKLLPIFNLLMKMMMSLMQIKDAFAFAFAPPPLPELGSTQGLAFFLTDNAGLGREALVAQQQKGVPQRFVTLDIEVADADELYLQPRHPYTEALLNSVPIPDPQRIRQHQILSGEIPSPINPPNGCHFHPRCPYAQEICRQEYPPLQEQTAGHSAACHFSSEVGRFRNTNR